MSFLCERDRPNARAPYPQLRLVYTFLMFTCTHMQRLSVACAHCCVCDWTLTSLHICICTLEAYDDYRYVQTQHYVWSIVRADTVQELL